MSKRKILWQEMRRVEFPEAAKAGAVVIIPIGSTEQHGPHLPVNTDMNCCWTIATRAAQAVEEFPVIVTPPIWSGQSPHHMRFPGAITLKLHTLVDVITEICESIAAHGFKKMIVLNGHGGNSALVQTLCQHKLRYENGLEVIPITYWDLIPEVFKEVMEVDRPGVGHAGEAETSLQLYLQPDLVEWSLAQPADGVHVDPRAATKEKGRRIVEAAVKKLAEVIREYHARE